MTSLRDTVLATYEEASVHQVWRDAMVEEYNSIMKNDVWEVVPRSKGKSVVLMKLSLMPTWTCNGPTGSY